jgi:hypothetical protein
MAWPSSRCSSEWLADPTVLTETEYDVHIFKTRMRELAYLNPVVRFEYIDEQHEDETDTFHFTRGIPQLVEDVNDGKDALHPVVYFKRQQDADAVAAFRLVLGKFRFLDLGDLVWNDRNFMDLFTANYGFVNADLAPIYKVPAPAKEFDKVAFPAGSDRAGLLGQGLFLALTAKPEESSPTARGLFVREREMFGSRAGVAGLFTDLARLREPEIHLQAAHARPGIRQRRRTVCTRDRSYCSA